jgi:hypothetical protein
MEPSEIAKETLNLSKVTFDNAFNAMLILQEQVQRMIDIYFHQMLVFPDEGKRVADTLTEVCRTGREEFKKVVETNYEMIASFLNDAEKKSKN